MARKTAAVKVSSTTSVAKPLPKAAPGKVASSTPVRNSAIPKVAAPAKREITRDMIAVRAFEISTGGTGGSELDNWLRAERELKAGI
jgi:hypothetical protein